MSTLVRQTILPAAIAGIVLIPPLGLADDGEKPPDADTIRQSLDKIIHKLEDLKKAPAGAHGSPEDAGRALADLDAQLKAISKYEHGERELKGEVGGGFDGDKAPIDGADGMTTGELDPVTASNADPATSYKINSAVTLTRGSYPQRFRLKTSVGVLLSEKKFQEDVSTLLMSYDHFTSDATGIYGFAERISDSYLSIDQRWEVGGGGYLAFRRGLTKAAARELIALCHDPQLSSDVDASSKVRSRNGWGRMARPCTPSERGDSITPRDPRQRAKAEAARAKRDKTTQVVPELTTVTDAEAAPYATHGWDPVERTVYPVVFGADLKDVSQEEKDKAAADLYHLREIRENAIRSIQQRGARIEIGLATSVFSEIERSTIKVLVNKEDKSFVRVSGPNTETKSVTLDGAHVFRLTLRPTVRLRPSTHIYFEAFSYFKQRLPWTQKVNALTLDAMTKVAKVGRTTDWRVDAHSELRYILSGAETLGGEKFSVVGSYDFHWDSAPPFLSTQVLKDQGILGVSGDGISARSRHHVFKILLTVGWAG
jgi:hypothetical protein